MLFVDDLLPPIALRAITRVYSFVTFVSLYLTSLYFIVFPTTEFKNIDEHQVPPLPQPPPPSILVPLYTPPPNKKTHWASSQTFDLSLQGVARGDWLTLVIADPDIGGRSCLGQQWCRHDRVPCLAVEVMGLSDSPHLLPRFAASKPVQSFVFAGSWACIEK